MKLERTLEIAASTRVLRDRQRTAAASAPGGVRLGRHFVTLHGLAERCAAETGRAMRGWLDAAAHARIVESEARHVAPYARLLETRPGLVTALASSLRDLRDAGVEPEALADGDAALRALFARTERRLARLADSDVLDRIALFRRAARGAHDWVARLELERAELHGATELVGSAGDLIEALAAVIPVQMFQPDCADAYAEALRDSWPWSNFRPARSEVLDQPLLAPGAGLPDDAVAVVRAPDRRREVDAVVAAVLERLDGGADPDEILIVARHLEPYAPWLESAFARFALPWASSLGHSLLRAPRARAWVDWAELLLGPFDAEVLLRLLGEERLRVDGGRRRRLSATASRLARLAPVVRGLDDWRAALAEHETPANDVDAGTPTAHEDLAALFVTLEPWRARAREAASFAALVEILLEAGAGCLVPPEGEADSEADTRVAEAWATLEALDTIAGPRDLEDALEAVRLAVADTTVRTHDPGDPGIRVLDALQARGLAADHVFVIGLNHGVWPRDIREDAFLGDEARETLRTKTRRPVPIGRLAEMEERFLLGLMLSQARQSLWLSWSESDASGRALAPSAYLRSLPYVGAGSSALERAAAPGHSALLDGVSALERCAAAGGDVLALAHEVAPGCAAMLEPGLALVHATDAYEGTLAYDASVAPVDLPAIESFSPSALDGLGKCPQKAFFRTVLRVDESESPPATHADGRESGTWMHEVLQVVFTELFEAGHLAAGTPLEVALAAARARLPAVVREAGDAVRARPRASHPAVWHALIARTQRAVDDFLARDLARLLPDGITALETEAPIEGTIRGSHDAELKIVGRVDRIATLASGTLEVGDYKTGRNSDHLVGAADVSKGLALQIPVYAIAAAEAHGVSDVRARVLHAPQRPERDFALGRATQREIALDVVLDKGADALAALVDSLRAGDFPFRYEMMGCRYCAYSDACRCKHPASEERIARAEEFRAYLTLHEAKS